MLYNNYHASYFLLGFLSFKFIRGVTPCITNNKLNINSINGSLALTALREKFFDGEYTSAAIVSKKSFNLSEFGTKFIIKLRAAFTTDLDIYPRILLMTDSTLENPYDSEIITVLNYKDGKIWNGLWQRNGNTTETELRNLTDEINVHQFQDYQFEYYNKTFKYILNQKEYLIRKRLLNVNGGKIFFEISILVKKLLNSSDCS